jgi:hypothetical protein
MDVAIAAHMNSMMGEVLTSRSLDRLDDDTNFAIGCPEHRGPVISVRSSLQAPACSAALTGTTR